MKNEREADGLYTVWERSTRRSAWGFAIAAAAGIALLAAALRPPEVPWLAIVPLAFAGAWGVYRAMSARIRRRRACLARPFPPEWEAVLQREVVFFRALDPGEQSRFRRELQVFLDEKRITGVGTEVDTTTLVLVGASAIIPIFGFPEWEWDQINEVLIYPSRFNEDFSFDEGEGRHTLGMVGTGPMSGVMILAQPDLLAGFRNPNDKRNVGVHEFAHLVDKSDGSVDGLPGVGLDRRAIGPWVELVRRKMAEIESGDSDVDRYALTNEAEFFAVASEYFFERPGVMQRKHPELYGMLERAFRQDLGARLRAFTTQRTRTAKKIGRNSRCPCGSGRKYKRCCLRKMRPA